MSVGESTFLRMSIDQSDEHLYAVARVRERSLAVERARAALSECLVDRDAELALARELGVGWSSLQVEAGLGRTGIRLAAARGCLRHNAFGGNTAWLAIDPAITRVRDDAVRVNRLPDGRWLVEVATPAVSDVVGPGGAVDLEAYRRKGVTVQNGRRIGMLPTSVESTWSLSPTFDRAALVVAMTYSQTASLIETVDVRRETIRTGLIAVVSYDDGHILPSAGPAEKNVDRGLVALRVWAKLATTALVTKDVVAHIATSANVSATRWALNRGLTLLRESPRIVSIADGIEQHGQITNPLRRYSNLINQRIVLAALDGKAHPYPGDALMKFVGPTGYVDRGTRQEWTAYERAIAVNELRLDSAILAALPVASWRGILDAARSEKSSDSNIADAFRARRAYGLLGWQDFDWLLTANGDWQDLQDEMTPWMRTHRPDIVHELLRNFALRADATVDFEFTRPDAPVLTAACACRVLLNGFATPWCVVDAEPWMDRPVVQCRKAVRHDAAWAGVEVLLGRGDYVDISVDPEYPAVVSDLGFDGPRTAFSNLRWVADKNGYPAPTFDTVDVAPDAQTPLYRCTASGFGLTATGEGFRAGLAKEKAAHALWTMVGAGYTAEVESGAPTKCADSDVA